MKRICLLLIIAVLVFLAAPGMAVAPPAIAGQPVGVNRYDLNGEWSFATDQGEIGEREKWFRIGPNPPNAEEVSVPHTWNTMKATRDYEGVVWYRKAFVVPPSAAGHQVRLVFDAAFYLAKVWFNGILLGTHEGGYTRFEFDVTKLVQPDELNFIAVRLDNRRDYNRVPARLTAWWSYDWWGYGGLVRDVYLVATGPLSIHHAAVVAVPNEDDTAKLDVRAFIDNATGASVAIEMTASILPDGGGPVLLTGSTAPVTAAAGRSVVDLSTMVKGLKLWHFDRPNVYRLELTVRAKGVEPSGYCTTFGLRKVEIKGTGLYLNGERVRLAGIARHADSPWYGSAEPGVMMARDFDDLKRLNTVLSRPVHYPQHQYILDYCDRNGILLIPEVPAWQLGAQQMSNPKVVDLVKQQLREMIESDGNHPCIWAWSLCNEIESNTGAGKEFVRTLYSYVKGLDPSRYVSFASNRLAKASGPDDEASGMVDFLMMNQYFGTWAGRKQDLGPALERIHNIWPEKMMIISEFGYEPNWPSGARPTDVNSYYIASERASVLEHDLQRQAVIKDQLKIFRRHDFIAGAIFWSYADYRSPSKYHTGLVDAERNPLPAYFLLAREYSPAVLDSLVTMAARVSGFYAAELVLHTRGPLEQDLPAYRLKGYRVRWTVLDDQGGIGCVGEAPMPDLTPGSVWKYAWDYEAPYPHRLKVEVLRPTGVPILTEMKSVE